MLLGACQAPHRGLEHRRELVAAAFLEDVVDGPAVLLPEPLERRLQLRLAPRADDARDVAVQRLLPGHHRVVQLRGLRPRQLVVDELAGVPVGAHEPHQELLERVLVERAGGDVLLERRRVGGAVGLPDGDEVVRRRRAGDLDEHPHVPVALLLQGLVGELGVTRRRVHGPQHHRALAGDAAGGEGTGGTAAASSDRSAIQATTKKKNHGTWWVGDLPGSRRRARSGAGRGASRCRGPRRPRRSPRAAPPSGGPVSRSAPSRPCPILPPIHKIISHVLSSVLDQEMNRGIPILEASTSDLQSPVIAGRDKYLAPLS